MTLKADMILVIWLTILTVTAYSDIQRLFQTLCYMVDGKEPPIFKKFTLSN